MKHTLKEQMLKARDSMPKEDAIKKSVQIKSNLFDMHNYKNSKTIMFFVSLGSEPDTREIIKSALQGKIVIVPKIDQNDIEPSIIISLDSMVRGKYGILEPLSPMKTALKNIDLVLVPGIAFDSFGHRVGYGFGYYDRFLRKVPKAIKIGLAFDFQVIKKIPNEPHDVPVDYIVTEERIIECKR